MNIKRPYAAALGKANKDLDTYINWLEDTGRLTSEERIKLINLSSECVFRAQDFGSSGESA